MSQNLRDFQDANLAGMAAVERWRMEYEAMLVEPLAEEMIEEVYASLSSGQRDILKMQNPEMFKQLLKRVKER